MKAEDVLQSPTNKRVIRTYIVSNQMGAKNLSIKLKSIIYKQSKQDLHQHRIETAYNEFNKVSGSSLAMVGNCFISLGSTMVNTSGGKPSLY